MKYKLTKQAWLEAGQKIGWLKTSQNQDVTVLPREADAIMAVIASFGSKRFMIGFHKKDGSYRVMHAQRRVSKYRTDPEYVANPRYQNMREQKGLVEVYDLDVARNVRANIGGSLDHLPEEEKKKAIDIALRKSYRNIYPDTIETIRGLGKVWVVEGAEETENIALLEQAQAQAQAEVPVAPELIEQEEALLEPVAKAKLDIQKLSSILWSFFERRMRLR